MLTAADRGRTREVHKFYFSNKAKFKLYAIAVVLAVELWHVY